MILQIWMITATDDNLELKQLLEFKRIGSLWSIITKTTSPQSFCRERKHEQIIHVKTLKSEHVTLPVKWSQNENSSFVEIISERLAKLKLEHWKIPRVKMKMKAKHEWKDTRVSLGSKVNRSKPEAYT